MLIDTQVASDIQRCAFAHTFLRIMRVRFLHKLHVEYAFELLYFSGKSQKTVEERQSGWNQVLRAIRRFDFLAIPVKELQS